MAFIFNPKAEKQSMRGLMREGIVMNKKGKIQEQTMTKEDRKKIYSLNPMYLNVVISGVGSYDVWRSNLQKCIRIGNVNGAMKSAVEMMNCGMICMSNMMNRLCKVICVEDIGVANPLLIVECCSLLKEYNEMKLVCKNLFFQPKWQKKVLSIVKSLALSPKSRLSDNAFCSMKFSKEYQPIIDSIVFDDEYLSYFFEVFEEEKEGKEKSLRKKLIDMCYALMLGIGLWKASQTTTSFVSSVFPISFSSLKKKKNSIIFVWNILFRVAKTMNPSVQRVISSLFELFSFKGNEQIIHLCCAIELLLFEKYKILNMKPFVCEEISDSLWKEMEEEEIYPLARSYDKHTKYGKKLKRGVPYFFRSGAMLSKVPLYLCPFESYFYNLCCQECR